MMLFDSFSDEQPWRRQAACDSDEVTAQFLNPHSCTYACDTRGCEEASYQPLRRARVAEAKRVCMSCPVRIECLESALEQPEREGVRGGLTSRQRKSLRAKVRAEEAA